MLSPTPSLAKMVGGARNRPEKFFAELAARAMESAFWLC